MNNIKPHPILASLSISRQRLTFKNPSLSLSIRGLTNGLIGFILIIQAIIIFFIGQESHTTEGYRLPATIIAAAMVLLSLFFIWEARFLNQLKKLEGEIDPEKNRQKVLEIASALGWQVWEVSDEAILMLDLTYMGYNRQISVLLDDADIWINISPFKPQGWYFKEIYPASYFGNRKRMRAFVGKWGE